MDGRVRSLRVAVCGLVGAALLASAGAASAAAFPPSLITNQEKIEWLSTEVDAAERALNSHMAKPVAQQDEAAYLDVLSRLVDAVVLSRTLAGGLPALEARGQNVSEKASAGLARLLNSKLKIGMTADQVRQLRGSPARVFEVTTAAGVREQWEYDSTSLSFDNGKLIEIRQIRRAE